MKVRITLDLEVDPTKALADDPLADIRVAMTLIREAVQGDDIRVVDAQFTTLGAGLDH